MKTNFLRQAILILLTFGSVLSIYFGAYLPYSKAKKNIHVINSLRSGNIKSLEQFKSLSNGLISFYSPIGQEETIRFFGREIISMMRNSNQQEPVMRELAKTVEPFSFYNNVRHLSAMGEMYSILWSRYGKEEDFQKAEFYLLKMAEIGPNLPPALYSLFEMYKIHGDKEKMVEIGERILKNWPGDKNIEQVVGSVK